MINRDTIIAHALKSGFAPGFQPGQTDALCKFAEFVAAAEREACAQACVASDLIDWPTSVEVAAIRKCAAAIRARSKE